MVKLQGVGCKKVGGCCMENIGMYDLGNDDAAGLMQKSLLGCSGRL